MAQAAEPDRLRPAVHDTARRLRLDHLTAEVLSALEAGGVESILLKGASIADWLYRKDERRYYGDCDLLVRPWDRAAAEHVLRSLGLVPTLEESEMPGWWRPHSMEWFLADEGATVDLHRTVPGAEVDDELLWAALSADVVAVAVGGYSATALSIPGRAMHLALHAAQHGSSPLGFRDLERALAITDEGTWRAVDELAETVRARAAFAAGLRLVPAGEELATRLELPLNQPVEVALRAGGAPAPALTLEQLRRARGLGGRLRILRHKLVPPPTFMRAWSRNSGDNRVALALAYLRRPFWVLAQLPRALGAWRCARRGAPAERRREES